mmetsp:Transcript_13950/g.19186  ORF Transcript_13950/g.19186 Transcript_13950/m.19186 type:complete len:309 (-) Transcript_13950:109-1035(-)|eukprot:CAMPEP_0196580190 /NCGR_PEP_ID=MMETSP1081-20130531/27675_1 /TAXON_ID=36882 /ORGANISM="Pyramimonas amylifera, Strain CCMP720" /LENGTH=308 /DNA_ID=CAMNT_0041899997 /DNA_START=42 /DNA_END=968 /DNA_ORIENTATION=-
MTNFLATTCPSVRFTNQKCGHVQIQNHKVTKSQLTPNGKTKSIVKISKSEGDSICNRRIILAGCACGCCSTSLNPPSALAGGLSDFDWYKQIEAAAMETGMQRYESEIEERKAVLFSQLPENTKEVLELGLGTGPNLKFYKPETHVIGVEPNEYMDAYAKSKAEQFGLELEIKRGCGEALPLDDNSVDAVITSLVLCTVDSPSKVMREIVRVLRPGGKYLFIEHVGADPVSNPALRFQQTLFDPLQQFVAGGCHLTRDTGKLIRSFTTRLPVEATFQRVDIESFMVPEISLIAPHISGVATKAEHVHV